MLLATSEATIGRTGSMATFSLACPARPTLIGGRQQRLPTVGRQAGHRLARWARAGSASATAANKLAQGKTSLPEPR